ncbi:MULTISPECIES: ATP-binding protein [Frankia]|uniref:Helicase HerA central domain-containing protein n=1 Tax=Frankia alni (strain DSM 45986 / CECT 9034 / ACN14a) TaxID=326424 RepID=Q0RMG0_FRAAA|nr:MULTISPECIES: ATP-binding protein [Frankia]CAJ61291.1 hypothetical protein; putative IMP dehydrogenase / GMP reductase domain [Frankia alni ACN14a]
MTDLSRPLATRIATLLVDDFLRGATAGRCLRLDHLLESDCHAIRDAAAIVLAQLPPSSTGGANAQVAVLGTENRADDTVISPERAIELRNRKIAALLLLVPAGVDSPAASSLENSFEAIDLEQLFKGILRDLENHLPRPLRDTYDQVLQAQSTQRRVFPLSRHARAEYLLALHAAANESREDSMDSALHAAGANLHLLGLIPDLGGAPFTERLVDNAACVAALVKPARAQDDARTRLRNCPLHQHYDDAYRAIERFIVAVPRLSERTWLRELAAPAHRELTFEHWPLNPSTDSDLLSLYVNPFAVNGVIPAGTGLRDPQDGTLPTCSAKGGFVKLTWSTEPAKPKDVTKWSVEMLPSKEFYGPETDFDVELPTASPKGTAHSSKLTINLDPEGVDRAPAVVVVRIQALDRNGQVLKLADGEPAQAISQEFALDSTPPSESTSVRRESAPSLPIARLRAAAEGAEADIESCEGWQESDLAYLQLRFGRRHGGRMSLSIPLRELQQQILETPDNGGRYAATVPAGQLLTPERTAQASPDWASVAGRAFSTVRREFFEAVRGQSGRGLVEVADFDDELTALANRYTATYSRILQRRDGASLADLHALTALDTLRLRVVLGRRNTPVDALVVLPTHPLRVAWYAAYYAELESWRRQLRAMPARERAAQVDLELLARLSPARVPFLLNNDAGAPYVFTQNLRLLHGLYLPVDESDPATAVSEIINALGLPASDVSVGEVPASRLADRVRLYRGTHQHPARLRILATNPGSGAFLADALSIVTTEQDEDSVNGEAESSLPPHLYIQAFGEGASETSPLPALRELQRDLLETRSRTRRGRGFLDPELELSVAPLQEIDAAHDAHLAVLTDLSRPELVIARTAPAVGSMSFHGLITRPVTERDPEGGWVTGIDFPTARGAEVTEIHRRFAEAVTTLFVAASSVPADAAASAPATTGVVPLPDPFDTDATVLLTTQSLAVPVPPATDGPPPASAEPRGAAADARVRMEVSGMTKHILDIAHERCDWVIVLDRFLGLDSFDDPSARTASGRRYILDYAPEFLDGIGQQMAITTAYRADVEKMFYKAMIELGFTRPDESVSSVIDELLLVSGRLVLAATGDDNRAKEAVALAAVVAHLRRRGELENTIVIPVDAHPELFGVHAQRQSQATQQQARRCDLLLVRFPSSRRVSIEAVEVKSRGMLGSEDLGRDIASQVLRTNELVEGLFFKEPARIDRPLQRARLASLLRFYLRRAVRRGLVTNEAEFHRATEAIERLDNAGLTIDYRGSGYIVVLHADGTADFQVDGVRIRSLTANNLGADDPAGAGVQPAGYVLPPCGADALTVLPPAQRAASEETEALAETTQAPHRPDDVLSPHHDQADTGVPDTGIHGDGRPVPTPEVPEPAAPDPLRTARVTLGRTLPPEEEIVWEASTSGSPHLFILGIPGQGKSETTIRLLQGAAADGLPALVIDFHGQFGTDARRPPSLRVYNATDGLPFSPFEITDGSGRFAYRINATSISEIFGYVCGLGDIQRDVFYQALAKAYEDRGHGGPTPAGIPTLDEVRDNIAALEKERGVQNVLARCRPLLEYGLFTDSAGAKIQDLIREGLVVDLHGFAEVEQAQIAAGAFLLRKVYRDMFSWGQTGELRLAIVLDEAHRLAKDATLPKLMKEGRKFGVAVIVASQGIDDFHPDVLANAGTKIVFRMNYPQSRKAAGFLHTRAGKDLSEDLEQLPVGDAYIQTPIMTTARRTRMLRPEGSPKYPER